ncbi:hypothetical protein [Neptunomonas sp.]|uniref:hypothetical protein n=1 Tax=Neptunomonas sp. TaxID=1971898 RepID=UPI0035684A16
MATPSKPEQDVVEIAKKISKGEVDFIPVKLPGKLPHLEGGEPTSDTEDDESKVRSVPPVKRLNHGSFIPKE